MTMTSAAKRRKTQIERSSASELRLLNAAAALIVEEGVASVTFDRVGEASGFSRGLASQKFGSKEGLVRGLVDFLEERLNRRYDDGLVLAQDPLDEIATYSRVFFDELEKDPMTLAYFVLLAGTIANKDPAQPRFVDTHNRVKELLADMIRRGQAAGLIRADLDPETVALAIGSFQLGVATQLRLDPTLDVGAISRLVLPLIRSAFAPDGRG